ncbi:MAG: hypothetical protein ACLRSW_05735 [Christensenellaceae bacterium]
MEIFGAVTDERSRNKNRWEEGLRVRSAGERLREIRKRKEISVGDLEDGVVLCHAGTKRKDGSW